MNTEKVEKLKQRLSDGRPISIRPSEEDRELLIKLYVKKQLPLADLYRNALRAYAEVERVY